MKIHEPRELKAPGPLVRIWWDDIRDVDGGWLTVEDIDKRVTRCLSVGWLVHEDDHSVVIVGSTTDAKDVGSGIIIPVAAINSWEDIEAAE